MKKLGIEQLQAMRGGNRPRLRTCMVGGFLAGLTIALGFSSTMVNGGMAFFGSMSAANYKGCFD